MFCQYFVIWEIRNIFFGADEEAVGLQPGVSVIELVPGPEHGEAEVVRGREPGPT